MSSTWIRLVAQGEAWFAPDQAKQVLRLMLLQCSATRCAYQGIHKKGIRNNELKKHVKKTYMADLNQRYVADACSVASGIKQEDALFGGKQAWRDMRRHRISKEQWQAHRNSRLYSRGDASHGGNPNIRIVVSPETGVEDKILVNDPSQYGKWIEGKIFIPEKFKPNFSCYDVRLMHVQDGKFKVSITWEALLPAEKPVVPGAIGIDTNPDGVALSNINKDGNLVSHHYEKEQRIQYASKGKRTNDIRLLARRIVDVAEQEQKPIVLENLSFKRKHLKTKKKGGKKGSKKARRFNRMCGNFCHKQIVEAVKREAQKRGIKVIEVEPAFTSVLGGLKYQKPLSLPIHAAAALCIGRRGMGLLERMDFNVSETDKLGADNQLMLNLEGRGMDHRLSRKAWTWLENCFLKPKPAILTGSHLAAGSRPATGCSGVQSPGEANPTTGQVGQGRGSLQADEKAALGLGS